MMFSKKLSVMKILKHESKSKQLGTVVKESKGGGYKPQNHVKNIICLVFAMEKENPLCRAQCDKQLIVICTWCSIVATLHELYKTTMS
jgi:hypothetical protein